MKLSPYAKVVLTALGLSLSMMVSAQSVISVLPSSKNSTQSEALPGGDATAVSTELISALQSPESSENPENQDSSILTLKAELPRLEILSWFNRAVPEQFDGTGQKKVCKRILGLKACGNARWRFDISRTGDIKLPMGAEPTSNVMVGIPMRVDAVVGVDGDVARALGIQSVPVTANLVLWNELFITGDAWGCPVLQNKLKADWTSKPTAVLAGSIKVSLSEVLESALDKQVKKLQRTLNQALNCNDIYTQLNPLWATCHVDVSRQETGPSVWVVQAQKIHWSMQSSPVNQSYSLLFGIDAQLDLRLGLSEQEHASRLQLGECAKQWSSVVTTKPSSSTPNSSSVNTNNLTGVQRLVFQPAMGSNSSQSVKVSVTHEAISNFARDRFTNRNLGKDENGNQVSLDELQLMPGDDTLDNSIVLTTRFNAWLKPNSGFMGWVQSLLGYDEKNLAGNMHIEATPVWNAELRELQFSNITTSVTEVEPGSTLSIDKAVLALLQRHVQSTLNEQSQVSLGKSIDGLVEKLNGSLDAQIQQALITYGGQWRTNTADIEINDIVALNQGLQLSAELKGNWVAQFTSEKWPNLVLPE